MNIRTKGTNLFLTPAISVYIEKRMDKISRLIGEDASVQCDVELAKTTEHHHKGDIFRAEIHVIGPGRNIYASSEKEDLYVAIDEASDETLRGLKSNKKKYLTFVRRGGTQVKAMIKGLWPWRK
jgi:ribosomal subunit interface protein